MMNTDLITDLIKRVERLERENYLLKVAVILTGIVLASTILTAAAGQLFK